MHCKRNVFMYGIYPSLENPAAVLVNKRYLDELLRLARKTKIMRETKGQHYYSNLNLLSHWYVSDACCIITCIDAKKTLYKLTATIILRYK